MWGIQRTPLPFDTRKEFINLWWKISNRIDEWQVFCSLLTSPTETLHVLVVADSEAQEDSVYYLNYLYVNDKDNTELSWTKWRMVVFLLPTAVEDDAMLNDEYDCLPA